MSMKNSIDTIGNRTRDLPAFASTSCATACPLCSCYESWKCGSSEQIPM